MFPKGAALTLDRASHAADRLSLQPPSPPEGRAGSVSMAGACLVVVCAPTAVPDTASVPGASAPIPAVREHAKGGTMECESVAVRGRQGASHGQPWDDDPPLRIGPPEWERRADPPGTSPAVTLPLRSWDPGLLPAPAPPQPIDSMLRSTTSIVVASSSVGWNSTTSVPAKISGRSR